MPTRSGWTAYLVTAVARAALLVLAGLLLWSVVPAAAGWSSTVVMSDSMAPRMFTGDVVLVRPAGPDELRVGQILLVDDPDRPARLRLHRLTAIDPTSGVLTLKGDANARADSAPVHIDAVHGVAALRVPWIGSPLVWWDQGRTPLVAGTAAVLTALVAGLLCYRPLTVLPGSSPPPTTSTAARASAADGGPAAHPRSGAEHPSSSPELGNRTDTQPLPRVPDLADMATGWPAG